MQQQFVVYDIQCNDGNGVFRTTITGEICYMDILHVVDVTPMGQEMIFILWNLYTLTYSHYIFQGWMMIVKFCLPILYFWVGYNAVKEELDLWVFLKRTVLICVIYSFLIGGVSAKQTFMQY